MKIKDITFKVLSSEKKSGTSTRGDWEKTEYTILESVERDDGSINENTFVVDCSTSVDELQIGATYTGTIYISSRSYEKDGKTMYFPSFRVTFANLITPAPNAEPKKEVSVSDIGDDIPF